MGSDWTIPFRSRGFTWLFVGELISALGTWASYVIIPLLVYDLTHDPVSVGILMVCRLLPGILLAPVIGRVMAKHSILRVMILADLVRGLAFLSFLWLQTPLWIYLLTLVISAGNAFFGPGQYTLIPKLVPQEVLARANSYIGGSNQFMMLIGPAIGGVVFAFTGKEAGIVFNALSYFVSMAALMRIRVESVDVPLKNVESGGVPQEVPLQQAQSSNGRTPNSSNSIRRFFGILTSLWSRKILLFLLLSVPIANLGFGGALNTLFPVIAKDVFSGEAAYGTIMSCLGGGLFLGTMIGPLLLKKAPAPLIFSVATVVAAVGVFLFGGSDVLLFSLAVIFLVGTGNGVADNAAMTYMQTATSQTGDTADVLAVDEALASIGTVVGMSIATTVAALWNAQSAIMMLSLCPVVAGVAMGMLLVRYREKQSQVECSAAERV